MPTPRSLSTAPNQDLDLQLVHGTWPETIHGEVLYSGPRVSGKSPAAIFDFGGLTRLSLRPGTYGAPADRFQQGGVGVAVEGGRFAARRIKPVDHEISQGLELADLPAR